MLLNNKWNRVHNNNTGTFSLFFKVCATFCTWVYTYCSVYGCLQQYSRAHILTLKPFLATCQWCGLRRLLLHKTALITSPAIQFSFYPHSHALPSPFPSSMTCNTYPHRHHSPSHYAFTMLRMLRLGPRPRLWLLFSMWISLHLLLHL